MTLCLLQGTCFMKWCFQNGMIYFSFVVPSKVYSMAAWQETLQVFTSSIIPIIVTMSVCLYVMCSWADTKIGSLDWLYVSKWCDSYGTKSYTIITKNHVVWTWSRRLLWYVMILTKNMINCKLIRSTKFSASCLTRRDGITGSGNLLIWETTKIDKHRCTA